LITVTAVVDWDTVVLAAHAGRILALILEALRLEELIPDEIRIGEY
jgi:hypothetical protein